MSEQKRWAFRPVVVLSAVLLASAALILSGLTYLGIHGRGPRVPRAHKVVRAQRIEVVDAQGRVRAELHVLNDGRPSLNLWDEDMRPVAVLHTQRDGTPRLALMDRRGRGRCVLYVMSDGSPVVHLYDEQGKAVFSAP